MTALPYQPDDQPAKEVSRLPLPFRIARWWSVRGPRRGRWRVWELAARLSGRGRLFRTHLDCGLTVLLDLGDPMSRYPIVYGGMPEPALARAIRAVLAPGDIFLDIGANFGYYALLAATLVGPQGAVHAFEPQPQVAWLLRRNAMDNHLRQLTVHQLALSDQAGLVTMYVPVGAQSGLATLRPEARWRSAHAARLIQVQMARLDDWARERGLGPVRALKLDAEGYELAILRGATELLDRCRPVVFFEADDDTADPRPLLADLGYRLFRLRKGGLAPVGVREALGGQQNLCALDPGRHDPAEVAP